MRLWGHGAGMLPHTSRWTPLWLISVQLACTAKHTCSCRHTHSIPQVILMCNIGGTLETTVSYRREKKIFADPERQFGRESRALKAAYELMQVGVLCIALCCVQQGARLGVCACCIAVRAGRVRPRLSWYMVGVLCTACGMCSRVHACMPRHTCLLHRCESRGLIAVAG